MLYNKKLVSLNAIIQQSDDIKCKLTGVEDSGFVICTQVATPLLFWISY